MKFLDLKDIESSKLEEFLEIFKNRKELREFLGGCPSETERVNPECFYCDECWISAIARILTDRYSTMKISEKEIQNERK